MKKTINRKENVQRVFKESFKKTTNKTIKELTESTSSSKLKEDLNMINKSKDKKYLVPPYQIEYWETQEDRDQGFGEQYYGFDENNLNDAINKAHKIFYDTVSAASVEVSNGNGDVVFGLYDDIDDTVKDESINEDDRTGRMKFKKIPFENNVKESCNECDDFKYKE